jgi:hypothetical protein
MLSVIGFVVFILREGMFPRCSFCDQGILDSGEEVSDRHQRVFNRYLKKYQSGQLLNNEAK